MVKGRLSQKSVRGNDAVRPRERVNFKTTVEEIASGAVARRDIVKPLSLTSVGSRVAGSASKKADEGWLNKLGANNLPSPGQSQTCKYSVVLRAVTFCVQRPHGSCWVKGLAVVP